jgi:hypothetical protein
MQVTVLVVSLAVQQILEPMLATLASAPKIA